MEEYQKKVNYLRHIKNIADIQQGHRKPTTLSSIFNHSHTRFNQQALFSPKYVAGKGASQLKTHTSTERIMRNFTVQKENSRLASKIINMNSSIPLKTYEKQYQVSKRYPVKQHKTKRAQRYFWFKFFDIKLGKTTSSSPDDYFKVFIMQNNKKILLAKDTLFELRKKELRLKKKPQILLKIEGAENEGAVRFEQNNLLEISRHGNKVGHIVIQHLKK